jgi:hypothetical protein
MDPLYGSPPWHLAGRAISILCRLDDPDEARKHVPGVLEMEADPIVRVRFWDLIHDSGFADVRPTDDPAMTAVREAVVAFPVRYQGIEGDHPAYMYADDPIYSAFGRETMGWPLRDAQVHVAGPSPGAGLGLGTVLRASLERHGRRLMQVAITLREDGRDEGDVATPPRWYAIRTIPGLEGPAESIRELALTGPSRFRRGRVHSADAVVEVDPGVHNELGWFRPREIAGAELWSAVDLTIGYGRSLADLRR